MAPTYRFVLENCIISNTRARHEDTDYVTFSVNTAHSNGAPRSRSRPRQKSLGDLNNGTHNIGLSIDVPVADETDIVIMNYTIVNCGHADPQTVLGLIEKAGKVLSDEGAKAAAAGVGAVIGGATIPLIGSALGAAAGWLVSTIGGMLFANCDGPVAMEQVVFKSRTELDQKVGSAGFSHRTNHPGTDSAWGCGSNSVYDVTWSITRIA